MRKVLLALAFVLLGAVNAFAQSTTVSGQVTDAGGQSWNNATCRFSFVPNPQFSTATYTWTGGALNSVISCTVNGTGAYSQSVPSNTAISPQGSKWILQVTPTATYPSFSTVATTVFGATQTLNVTPPAISISAIPGSSAYADAEISGPITGSTYFNVTSGTLRAWNGSAWVSIGGASSVTGAGTTNTITKWTSASAIGNSLATDDGTTLTYTGTGGIASAPSGGLGGVLTLPEGTTPTGSASKDLIWGDATNHAAHGNFNNVDVGVLLSQLGQTGNGTLTVGGGTSGSTIFKLNGKTSGSVTFTVPDAVSSTANPVASSNAISFPAGSATQPSICSVVVCSNQSGFFFNGNSIEIASAGTAQHAFNFTTAPEITSGSGGLYDWSPTANPQGSPDTGLSRGAAGVVDVGTGAQGSVAGQVNAAIFNPTPTTVTGLGAAAAGNKGFMRVVSDSTTVAAEGQTCVGSSTNTALAFSNGTVWKCF